MNYELNMLEYVICYFPAFLTGFCTCVAISALPPYQSPVIQRLVRSFFSFTRQICRFQRTSPDHRQ